MMEKIYPAHIRVEADKTVYQTVQEHCRGSAALAAKSLDSVHLYSAAYFVGLLHDLGKYTDAFREYIIKSSSGENVRKGSVNHTFAGVKYILSKYHGETPSTYADISAELLAYAVGAHHGLFDCIDRDQKNGFSRRYYAENIGYQEAVEQFLLQCADEREVKKWFDAANQELTAKVQLLYEISEDDEEVCFYTGLLARLLLSSVIEGDRGDTARFMNGGPEESPEKGVSTNWAEVLHFMEGKLDEFQVKTPIQRARQTLSLRCRDFGDRPAGIYRLNLPTGAGKTLSSLRAALAHAAKQEKDRIIFVMPLLSIIDQNAAILREYLGNDVTVLEHHSEVIHAQSGEELDRNELLAESWESPVIITTLVQFLHTLFAGQTTCIRRFHSLCNSVIVIDEVQTVPLKLLSLFNLAMNFLTEICNATVILCSATQPCLEECSHSMHVKAEPVVRRDEKLWSLFQRTQIQEGSSRCLDDIAEYLQDRMQGSTLLVCNTKNEAAVIYRQLCGIEKYYLSASMCMAHRRKVLKEIEQALSCKEEFVCVSTQVIEAGVDISFSQAIRLTAGMDSVLQTAGRCNRNRECEGLAPVWILRCDDEKLQHLQEIQRAKLATEELLNQYRVQPGLLDGKLDSEKAINYYYRVLYKNLGQGACDGPLKHGKSLWDLLSVNSEYVDETVKEWERYYLHQAFQEAGKEFCVFDTDTTDVIVPYGEGEQIITELCSERTKWDLSYKKLLLQKAKPFTVSVFQYQKEDLLRKGALLQEDGIYLLQPEHYDEELGLVMEQGKLDFMEV